MLLVLRAWSTVVAELGRTSPKPVYRLRFRKWTCQGPRFFDSKLLRAATPKPWASEGLLLSFGVLTSKDTACQFRLRPQLWLLHPPVGKSPQLSHPLDLILRCGIYGASIS